MRRDWSAWRHDVSVWLLEIGGVAAALGIAYLIWGGLRGYFAFYSGADPNRVASIANALGYYLYCCGWAIGLGLIGLFLEWRPIGMTMFLGSAFVWFIVPPLFIAVAGAKTSLALLGADALRGFLTPLLIIGFIQAVWAAVDYWRHGPTLRLRARKGAQLVFRVKEVEKRVPRRRPMLTPLSSCWKLPVMDRLMCEHCPVMKRRRPCWKLKAGCQCSPAIVDALLTGLSEEGGAKVSSLATGSLMVWQKGQKPPCHRCAIYLLHQQVKYDWLAPVSFFTPPVLLFLYWNSYNAFYTKVVQWLNQLWMQIAYLPPASSDPLGLNNQTMATYIGVVLCVMAMVYAIRLLEFILFKLYL